jgi:alpha-glucosidase
MKKLKQCSLLLFFILVGINGISANEKETVVNIVGPNKQISFKVFVAGEQLSYSVVYNHMQVINTSPLGVIADNVDLGKQVQIIPKPKMSVIHETYHVMGNHSKAYNHAKEAVIAVKKSTLKYNLIVRVYNDGVALRYTLPQGVNHIDGECTSWNLPSSVQKIAWAEASPCYENLSHVTSLGMVPEDHVVMGPLTVEGNGYFLSISEGDCENFPDMAFMKKGDSFRAVFPAEEKGWEIKKLSDINSLTPDGHYRGYAVTPWRTIKISKDLTGLVNSDLLMNVCPSPQKGRDFSWVKPGRCLWQWWSVGAPNFDDQKKWYDAAVKLKWEYYLIDEGWSSWKQGDKDEWALLKEVIDYGKKVGIKTLVWADSKEFRHAKERRAYLEKIKEVGASGIKIDFIPDATSEIMQWYVDGMEDCAELKLLLNYHGSVKPTGLERTYPNNLTREAVRGDEWHMSRYNRVMPLDQDVCLPFTRLMAGPADVTPVMLNPKELATADYTWAHEFSQAIIYLSPITHFCDFYQYYLDSPMFDLFCEIPTVWDETKVLSCTEMGKVVAYARRKNNTWWIGVMNGAEEKEIKIPLSFIRKSQKAILIYDSTKSKTSVDRREQQVTPGEVVKIKLAPGGGFIAKI